MLRLLMQHAELWTEFDMAWILYAMRKRRLRPRNPEQPEHRLWARVLRAVAAYFRQKMHFISPNGNSSFTPFSRVLLSFAEF